jgi:hypothetical protein
VSARNEHLRRKVNQAVFHAVADPLGGRLHGCRAPRGGAGTPSLKWLATGDTMSPLLYVIVILAMMPRPLLAQENSVEIPTQAPRPQPQAPPLSPPPHPGEGREGAPDVTNHRFVFHPIDGGFLRLDLVTGAVASCRQNAADWTCVPGREERVALDREVERLQRDNAALKNALLEHGVPLPNDMKVDAPTHSPLASGGGSPGALVPAETVPRPPQTIPPAASAPSAKPGEPDRASRDDAEIERIMTIMEKVWRRLVEMMMNIQRDLQKKG